MVDNTEWEKLKIKQDDGNFSYIEGYSKKSNGILETYVLVKDPQIDKYRLEYKSYRVDNSKLDILINVIKNRFQNISIEFSSDAIIRYTTKIDSSELEIDISQTIDKFDKKENGISKIREIVTT